jgi:hypothetical protein
MSEDGRIYVDAAQPAMLLDGAAITECPTLQEAVIAWLKLPEERKKLATIKTSDSREFTASEIDRLYYGPKPPVEPLPFSDTAQFVPEFYDAARRGVTLIDFAVVPPLPPAVSTHDPPSAGTAPGRIDLGGRLTTALSGAGGLTADSQLVTQPAKRTAIGRALASNREPIILTVQSFLLLLEEHIAAHDRPNSEEARAELERHLHIKRELEKIRNTAQEIEIVPEDAAVERTKSFAQYIRDWWNKDHTEICNKVFNAGLFLGCVGVCKLCGAEGDLAIVVSSVITGGKPVADALSSAAKLITGKKK